MHQRITAGQLRVWLPPRCNQLLKSQIDAPLSTSRLSTLQPCNRPWTFTTVFECRVSSSLPSYYCPKPMLNPCCTGMHLTRRDENVQLLIRSRKLTTLHPLG